MCNFVTQIQFIVFLLIILQEMNSRLPGNQGRPAAYGASPGQIVSFSSLTGRKAIFLAGADSDGFSGGPVASDTRGPVADLQDAETGHPQPLALPQVGGWRGSPGRRARLASAPSTDRASRQARWPSASVSRSSGSPPCPAWKPRRIFSARLSASIALLNGTAMRSSRSTALGQFVQPYRARRWRCSAVRPPSDGQDRRPVQERRI